MNKEDIAYTLRLTAMGRLNTPHQDEFCDKLARVFATLPAEDAAPEEPATVGTGVVTRTISVPGDTGDTGDTGAGDNNAGQADAASDTAQADVQTTASAVEAGTAAADQGATAKAAKPATKKA